MKADRVGLPSDGLGFVRRECPHCHRQFKVRNGPNDGGTVHRQLNRYLLLANHEELHRGQEELYCVYCGRAALSDDWCTPQQRAWIEKLADVLAKEIRFEQLAWPSRTLRDNPAPTYVPVPPSDRLPEMRREPDDMRRASFICCVEEVKVESHWTQPVYCPSCGAEHQNGSRHIRLEVMLAEA
ncbi:MAG: hypothetical protein WBV82_32045 [Myxococcaceae bacterium]